ncbi:pilus assembly protein [Azotobacter salinestris]|uniref:pilus assembly protein n=1 Tax=Azotobacter salinestris TaxID=69964 RepID=UPI0032E0279C
MLLGSHSVFAQDIDIYTGINPAGGNVPTVLLVWDNAANNSASAEEVCTQYADGSGAPSLGTKTAAGMEQCAMVNALHALRSDPNLVGMIRIGLMVFNKNDFNSGNGQCGYLVHTPQLMDREGLDTLIAKIKAFKDTGSNTIKTNSVAVGATMAEAWAALNGRSTSCSGVNYSTLAEVATQCRDAVLIYIGNAFTNSNPGDGGDADVFLKRELSEVFGYASGSNEYSLFSKPIAVPLLNTSGNTNNDYWADEWARFMKRVSVIDSNAADRNVTTYTISVSDLTNQAQAQSTINYYAEMAKQGGGKSFLIDVKDTDGLSNALFTVFNDVQAKNSVFASATLPVTANTQGTYLNQVFVAMFRPDGNASPRWYGNLKQYQLGLDAGGNIVLTDSTDNPDAGAVTSKTNPTTGAISPEAVSFWTANSPGVSGWPATGFWINSPSGEGLQYDSPDGDLVEKGGAAQMARADNLAASYADSSNDNGRNLWTCTSIDGCDSDLSEFSTANSTLMANALALFGAGAGTSYSGTLTAGVGFTTTQSVTCNTANSQKCTFNVPYSSDVTLTSGDIVSNSLTDTLQARCNLPAGCAVDSVLGSVFSFTLNGLQRNSTYSIPNGALFYKADRNVTVNTGAIAHGLNVGDSVMLKSCSVPASTDGTVYGLSGLPASGSRTMIVTGATTNTFTFKWESPALTLPGADVSCSIEPALSAGNLINWVRGWDVAGNEDMAGPGGTVTVRPSLHGDVLHSRPAVINYGGDTGVVVFYGANDGIFRAVNGNQTASIDGVRAGGELWGFIAPEFHGKFKRLFRNSPLIDIAGVMDISKQPKDYFFDGSTTVLRDMRSNTEASTKDKTYIYLTARRGGRLIYALDVTDPKTPKFLWRKTNADIKELGQTWSQPKVAVLSSRTDPVLIMGAGYAPEQDADPVESDDSMGRGVLILDAVTGKVVWAALADCSGVDLASDGVCVSTGAPTDAVAADVTLVDRNSDGYVDRVYAADVGGNIWRVDLDPNGFGGVSTPADWKITKLAALGGDGNSARKFLFAPDVVTTSAFDAIMAVSGDREHPLYTTDTTAGMAYNVQNRIYMIKDTQTGSLMTTGFTPLTDEDLEPNPDQRQPFDATLDTIDGYYIDLPNAGEKGVNAPVTVAGKTYFGTNYPDVPRANSCTADLGTALAYTLDFNTGKLDFTKFVGGGLPPSPVTGLVNIGDETVPFVIGGSGPTTFDPSIPEIELSNNRKRAYWYAK